MRALLELPPHGLKIIITTRDTCRRRGREAMVQTGPSVTASRIYRKLAWNDPYAENILSSLHATPIVNSVGI